MPACVSAQYGWLSGRDLPTARQRSDQLALARIEKVLRDSHYTYGVRRIHRKLPELSKRRVWRLMRQNGLKVRTKQAWRPQTTRSNPKLPVFKNLLMQDFHVDLPNQKWVTDITYIRFGSAFVYLAVVLDLFDRQIVGWQLSRRIDAILVTDALRMTIRSRKPNPGLIVHSDRASQYQSLGYRELLLRHGLLGSMSRKGNCYDNACAESFFHTMKSEWTRFACYKTFGEAFQRIYYYIERFYNRSSLHSAIGYRPPIARLIAAYYRGIAFSFLRSGCPPFRGQITFSLLWILFPFTPWVGVTEENR